MLVKTHAILQRDKNHIFFRHSWIAFVYFCLVPYKDNGNQFIADTFSRRLRYMLADFSKKGVVRFNGIIVPITIEFKFYPELILQYLVINSGVN